MQADAAFDRNVAGSLDRHAVRHRVGERHTNFDDVGHLGDRAQRFDERVLLRIPGRDVRNEPDLARRVGAYTLFATHYFELTQLEEREASVANVHLRAVEHKDRIVFLHSVERGPANQSYGLQVAALAGVPAAVLKRARKHLALLEQQQRMDGPQLGLFDQGVYEEHEVEEEEREDALREKLETVDPDELTPREALALLYELKQL